MISTVKTYCEFIKISHTIFALPFCLIAAFQAARKNAAGWTQAFWILIAFAAARAFAMAVNRILDRKFDAQNPRTAERHIPAGDISMRSAVVFSAVSAILFVLAAASLQPICLYLAPAVLAYLAFYSFTKRFTRWSHIVLGGALGIAPLGAEVAIRGDFSMATAVLAASVVFWVAAFDIYYAIQDIDFDRRHGLFSLPAAVGPPNAIRIAVGFHAMAFLLFLVYGNLESMGIVYFGAQAVVAGLLIYEHVQVRRGKIGPAFFQLNGILSMVQLAAVLLDAWRETSGKL